MKKPSQAFFHSAFLFSLILILNACQSAPKKEDSFEILTPEKELEVSKTMNLHLGKKFGVWKDPIIEKTLSSISKTITEKDELLKNSAKQPRFVLLNSNIPIFIAGLSNSIYVSRGALATIQYENELAYLLAMQMVMIAKQVPSNRFEQLQKKEVGENLVTLPLTSASISNDFLTSNWFESGGFFDYGTENYYEVDKYAVKIPQQAKYDHRGAASILKRWSEEPVREKLKSLWKFAPSIEDRYEFVRDEVAKLTPIRDPLLKSKKFTEFKNRVSSQ